MKTIAGIQLFGDYFMSGRVDVKVFVHLMNKTRNSLRKSSEAAQK